MAKMHSTSIHFHMWRARAKLFHHNPSTVIRVRLPLKFCLLDCIQLEAAYSQLSVWCRHDPLQKQTCAIIYKKLSASVDPRGVDRNMPKTRWNRVKQLKTNISLFIVQDLLMFTLRILSILLNLRRLHWDISAYDLMKGVINCQNINMLPQPAPSGPLVRKSFPRVFPHLRLIKSNFPKWFPAGSTSKASLPPRWLWTCCLFPFWTLTPTP